MIRRDVLTKIGFLDERFFLCLEDVDLCVRASAAGWDVYYYPRAKIIHHKGASARQNEVLARLALHQSYLAFYDKHWRQSHPWPVRWLTYLMVFAHIGFDRRLFVRPADTARLFQANRTAA